MSYNEGVHWSTQDTLDNKKNVFGNCTRTISLNLNCLGKTRDKEKEDIVLKPESLTVNIYRWDPIYVCVRIQVKT